MEKKYPIEEINLNEILIHNFLDINHMMRMLYEGKASQSRILIVLYEYGVVSQKDLTEFLGIKSGSSSEILSKLEKSGLISRIKSEKDHRIMEISLTDKGKVFAKEALEKRQNRHNQMFKSLDNEEKALLNSLLTKLIDDWNNRFTFSNVDKNKHNSKEK